MSEKTTTSLGELKQQQTQILADLRAACVAQKETWRQIPEWAYRANGRSGYSDSYFFAWNEKVWRINSSMNNRGASGYSVFVNLNTGEIVVPFPPYKAAADDYFLSACDPTEFDASAILARLKEKAAEPFFMEHFRTEYGLRMSKAGITDWVR